MVLALSLIHTMNIIRRHVAAPSTLSHIDCRRVSWFKKYRTILNSDIIHVRRPDLSGVDAMLHVNSNTTQVHC